MEGLSIKNTTKGKVPSLPFLQIKNKILGNSYELSLVFVGKKRMRRINRETRGKDSSTNILSFELSKKSGEIFICPSHLKGFNIGFLLIHGLFHLKGMAHGSTMERAEEKVRREFGI